MSKKIKSRIQRTKGDNITFVEDSKTGELLGYEKRDGTWVSIPGTTGFDTSKKAVMATPSGSGTKIYSAGSTDPLPVSFRRTKLSLILGAMVWGFLGASITNGSSSTNAGTDSYPALAIKATSRKKVSSYYLKSAWPGEPATTIAPHVDELIAAGVDGVIVGPDFATNWSLSLTLQNFKDACEYVIMACAAAAVRLAFCTPIPQGAGTTSDLKAFDQRAAYIQFVLKARGIDVIDTTMPMRGADGYLNLAAGYYAVGDKIHPINAGHAGLAAPITAYLEATVAEFPWPVSIGGYGALLNPLMADADANGQPENLSAIPMTGTFTTANSVVASAGPTDLPVGQWWKRDFNCTANGYQRMGKAITVVPGEDYVLYMYWKATGNLTVAGNIWNGSTTADISTIGNAVNDGPSSFAAHRILVPAGCTSLAVGIKVSGTAGQAGSAYLGSMDLYPTANLKSDLI